MLYSASTQGFYSPEIAYPNMPSDVVQLTQAQYEALLQGQQNGKQIIADGNGFPVLADYTDDSKTYAEKRAEAYPSIVDQLDMMYHEGYDGWKAQILAVKERFPKP